MKIKEPERAPAAANEMRTLIGAYDWGSTPLGPVERWPPTLKTVTDLILECEFPMILLWGPPLLQIYNDGYRALMGQKHPAGIGQPTRDCWPEVWHINEPIYARVWRGEAVTLTNQLFPITRHDFLEDAYFTLCYSPVRDEAGHVAGVLGTVFQTTERLKGERARREAADALRADEARKAREAALRESEERFRALVTAGSDVLYRMSPTWTEMRLLGGGGFLSDTDEPAQTWLEKYIPAEDQPEVLKVIQEAVRTRSVFELEHRVCRADGSIGWIFSRAVPLMDSRGEIMEWFGAATDITARRKAEDALRASLAERESLLKEVHHRVKNNLQVIVSLLEMQARQVDDMHAFSLFQEACNRVASIAAIHEVLYRSEPFAEVEMATYARKLVTRLMHFYQLQDRIEVEVLGDSFSLELERAVPCGLLLNELVSNACKHAFPGSRAGKLTVFLGKKGDELYLEVADSGVGLPEGMAYETTSSLGLVLVRRLAEQLGGSVRARSGPGAVFQINLPRHSGLR